MTVIRSGIPYVLAFLLFGLEPGCGGGEEEMDEVLEPDFDNKSDYAATRVEIQGSMVFGDEVSSAFDTSKYHGYTFLGSKDTTIEISLSGNKSQKTDTVVMLYGPKKRSSWTGKPIAKDDDGAGSKFSKLSDFVLPADGEYLIIASCKNRSYAGKTYTLSLACLADCEAGPRCGNNLVESGEVCDGTDLNGASCASLGFESGWLACDDNCKLDPGGCEGSASCRLGLTNCDGTCVDLRSHDTCGDDCGSLPCASAEVCMSGICQESCEIGLVECSGSCRDLNTPANCGKCGNVCGAGKVCRDRTCTTPPPIKGDINIEVDFVGLQRFEPGTIKLVVDYYLSIGYRLNIVEDEVLEAIDDLEWGSQSRQLKDLYTKSFGHRGQQGWHYMLMADDLANGINGWGMMGGDIFAISHEPLASFSENRVEAQAFIFMHELGHNLGLTHEGFDPERSTGTHDIQTCASGRNISRPVPLTYYSPGCIAHINLNSKLLVP